MGLNLCRRGVLSGIEHRQTNTVYDADSSHLRKEAEVNRFMNLPHTKSNKLDVIVKVQPNCS